MVSIYSSIKWLLVKKSISFSQETYQITKKSTIKLCLELIAFGMISTLLTFRVKYIEYGYKYIETHGVAIGRYKWAFLAIIVSFYLYKKCKDQFKDILWKRINRDDGLLIFKSKESFSEIKIWRDDFQIKLNKVSVN